MIKRFLYLFYAIFFIFVLLASIKNVNTSLTETDYIIFRNNNYPTLKRYDSKDELDLIRAIQFKVLNDVKGNDPIPNGAHREPYDLYKSRSGLCFDRSRLLDKAYQFAGFESRHVYILFKENRNFLTALFRKGQGSHAVTEVKTSAGWVNVDSNSYWLAVNSSGQPMPTENLWALGNQFDFPIYDVDNPFWSFPGLYTRGGNKYPPFIPFPEVSWSTFFNWVIHG